MLHMLMSGHGHAALDILHHTVADLVRASIHAAVARHTCGYTCCDAQLHASVSRACTMRTTNKCLEGVKSSV